MRVHLYTICWNEERMLPFFFRHYDPLIERYVFYDDGSSDSTLEILRRHPSVDVRRFERIRHDSFVLSAQMLLDEMWKESRGSCDWVVVTAVDEHLHHANVFGYLADAKQNGITAIPALGYEMVSADFPDTHNHLALTVTRGAPSRFMSKLSIFNPNAIEETHFTVGHHEARPTGDVRYPERDELINLHFKWMGLDYVRSRYALLRTGLGPHDRAKGFGFQYAFSDTEVQRFMEKLVRDAIDVAEPGLDHHAIHPAERWWRTVNESPKTMWPSLLKRWGRWALRRQQRTEF